MKALKYVDYYVLRMPQNNQAIPDRKTAASSKILYY